MFATTLFLVERPWAARQADMLNGELPGRQTLGFRRRELRIHAHNARSSSILLRHFGTASCLQTRRNPARSFRSVTELPQKPKIISKAFHPAQCCLLSRNPERSQLLAKHQPPSSDYRREATSSCLPASIPWVHSSEKRIRGTESFYFVSLGLVSLLHASNNKRHVK